MITETTPEEDKVQENCLFTNVNSSTSLNLDEMICYVPNDPFHRSNMYSQYCEYWSKLSQNYGSWPKLFQGRKDYTPSYTISDDLFIFLTDPKILSKEFCFNVVSVKVSDSSTKVRREEFDTEKLKAFVVTGKIDEARSYLNSSSEKSSVIEYWKKVLEKPKTKIENFASGKSLKLNSDWIKANSRNYTGQWVALKGGNLVGSDVSRINLHKSLKQQGKLTGSVFFRIDR